MKVLSIIFTIALLFSSQSLAKKPAHAQDKKMQKNKTLPKGLQKKLNRGKQLPPGWRKKIAVGQVVSKDILEAGTVLDPKKFGKQFPKTEHSKLYKIQDTIIRINKATNVILDVLKL